MNPVVLYVDDDAANLVVFESLLSKELPVVTARSGQEALKQFERHEVALLITDQRMPGMSGVDLVEVVQREHPDTVRMLVTAYSDLQAAVDAINRGRVHRYLKKPWEPNELRLVVRDAVERYVMGRRLAELERIRVATERVYSLGVVAASIAHELRNPLTSVTMNLDAMAVALERAPEGQVPEVFHGAVEDARQACTAILDIIASAELTTRSRGGASSDASEALTLAVRAVRAAARPRCRVIVDQAQVPPVAVPRTKLGQVMVNLLLNAVECFAEDSPSTNTVEVLLTSVGHQVLFAVQDNGPGIPPEALPRIFDPFFSTKVDGGTGLGLAITRRLIEDLGGTITVRSPPGAGTRFEVRLPAQPG